MFAPICPQGPVNSRLWHPGGFYFRLIILSILLLVASPVHSQVLAPKERTSQPAISKPPSGPLSLRVLVSQHRRILVKQPVRRIAVGDTSIATAQLINNKEILVLGQQPGRTTILVWLKDGRFRVYRCDVQRDLSILHAALHSVHPSINVRSAPDRDALILTGKVPDISYSQAAEGIAQKYVEARRGSGRQATGPFVKSPAKGSTASAQGNSSQASTSTATPNNPGSEGDTESNSSEPIRVTEDIPSRGTVINLIRLETLPPTMEARMRAAIENVGGKDVTVRRVTRRSVKNDEDDVFVLEGMVKSQVALLRVLEITSRMLTGKGATRESIRVIGDEAGALAGRRGQQLGGQAQAGQMLIGGGQGLGRLFGGGGVGRRARLNNQVQRNLGRAKVIEAAKGRIVSFVHVQDLPQIRVNIKLYEVNRTKLRAYSSDLVGAYNNFGTGQLNGGGSEVVDLAPTSGVQQILGFLAGTFASETFIQSGEFALESALSFLESLDLARSLSSPSLTVLSGEMAAFLVGGEIPISQVFSPFVGNQATPVVAGFFQTVEFRPFGVSLRVRPLVGEDGELTIDVIPQISKPDLQLTAAIEEASGTEQTTTSFESRSLQTSARLQDGQSLLIGGLLTRDKSDQQDFVPGIRDVPVLGWLFRRFSQNDEEMDLVVVVNPVIIREPIPDVGLWEFPEVAAYHPDWKTLQGTKSTEKGL